MRPSRNIQTLIEIMAALRTPGTGCPWDLDQNFQMIAPYTIEEAYEVADAIERGDMDDLRDELGDLLLQVVFHARMAEESGRFDFGDVCHSIADKLIRRHPHVFGGIDIMDADAVALSWEAIKAEERAARANPGNSILDDVPLSMPALMRAVKLQKRAGRIGFDWNDASEVLAKIREETAEIDDEIASGDRAKAAEEVGDLLFTVANLARHLGVDPETALRAANEKFRRRFALVEQRAQERDRGVDAARLDELEEWWLEAKEQEKKVRD